MHGHGALPRAMFAELRGEAGEKMCAGAHREGPELRIFRSTKAARAFLRSLGLRLSVTLYEEASHSPTGDLCPTRVLLFVGSRPSARHLHAPEEQVWEELLR